MGKRTRAHSGKVARVIQVCSGMEEGVLRCILGRRNSLVTILVACHHLRTGENRAWTNTGCLALNDSYLNGIPSIMHHKNSHCVRVAFPQVPCNASNNKSWQRKDTIIKHCTVRHCCELSSHLCLFITESLGQDGSKIGLESHLSTPRRFNSSSLVPERLSSACTSKAEPSSCY